MQTRCFNNVSDVASGAATLSLVRRAERRSGENNLLNTMCWASRLATPLSPVKQSSEPGLSAALSSQEEFRSLSPQQHSKPHSQPTNIITATQYNSCVPPLKQNINSNVSQSLLAIFLLQRLLLLFYFCANPNLLAWSQLARRQQTRLHKAGNIILQLCRISRLTPAGVTGPNWIVCSLSTRCPHSLSYSATAF